MSYFDPTSNRLHSIVSSTIHNNATPASTSSSSSSLLTRTISATPDNVPSENSPLRLCRYLRLYFRSELGLTDNNSCDKEENANSNHYFPNAARSIHALCKSASLSSSSCNPSKLGLSHLPLSSTLQVTRESNIPEHHDPKQEHSNGIIHVSLKNATSVRLCPNDDVSIRIIQQQAHKNDIMNKKKCVVTTANTTKMGISHPIVLFEKNISSSSQKKEEMIYNATSLCWYGYQDYLSTQQYSNNNDSSSRKGRPRMGGHSRSIDTKHREQQPQNLFREGNYFRYYRSIFLENNESHCNITATKLHDYFDGGFFEEAIFHPLPLTIRFIRRGGGIDDEHDSVLDMAMVNALERLGLEPMSSDDFIQNDHHCHHSALEIFTVPTASTDVAFDPPPLLMLEYNMNKNTTNKGFDGKLHHELRIPHIWKLPHKNTDSYSRLQRNFLPDAKIAGRVLQQEYVSMIPVDLLIRSLCKRFALHHIDSDNSNSNNKKTSSLSMGKSCRIKKQKKSSNPIALKFLDLCAAPGSKTLQLLDSLRYVLPKVWFENFLLVANDVDAIRAAELRSRCDQMALKGLENLLITSADARMIFSNNRCRNVDKHSVDDDSNSSDDIEKNNDGFDFILADVPCSSDGTVKKNPGKLSSKWNKMHGQIKASLQQEILTNGLQRLRPGGVLVYSTCSLNPVENSDVVRKALKDANNTSKDGKCSYKEITVADLHDEEVTWDDITTKKLRRRSLSGESSTDTKGKLHGLTVLPGNNHGGFYACALQRSEQQFEASMPFNSPSSRPECHLYGEKMLVDWSTPNLSAFLADEKKTEISINHTGLYFCIGPAIVSFLQSMEGKNLLVEHCIVGGGAPLLHLSKRGHIKGQTLTGSDSQNNGKNQKGIEQKSLLLKRQTVENEGNIRICNEAISTGLLWQIEGVQMSLFRDLFRRAVQIRVVALKVDVFLNHLFSIETSATKNTLIFPFVSLIDKGITSVLSSQKNDYMDGNGLKWGQASLKKSSATNVYGEPIIVQVVGAGEKKLITYAAVHQSYGTGDALVLVERPQKIRLDAWLIRTL